MVFKFYDICLFLYWTSSVTASICVRGADPTDRSILSFRLESWCFHILICCLIEFNSSFAFCLGNWSSWGHLVFRYVTYSIARHSIRRKLIIKFFKCFARFEHRPLPSSWMFSLNIGDPQSVAFSATVDPKQSSSILSVTFLMVRLSGHWP
jgi:hypothetical protein